MLNKELKIDMSAQKINKEQKFGLSPLGGENERGAAGLYDASFEHDACGIGFVANIKGLRL
jgi:hypothetical protein